MKRLSSDSSYKQNVISPPALALIAVAGKKSNIITTMVGQKNSEPTWNRSSVVSISFTRDDWRMKVDARNKIDESKVAGLEEQLRIVRDELAVMETDKESIERYSLYLRRKPIMFWSHNWPIFCRVRKL